MARLKIGDQVQCLIKDNNIISPYAVEYDKIQDFTIIASSDWGYYLYVPHYILITDSTPISARFCKDYDVDAKFIGEEVLYVSANLIYKIISYTDGCFCARCKDFYYQAAPNQPNGTLICWACRNNPYR